MPTIESICEGHEVSDVRRETLARAIELGADEATLAKLRDVARVSQQTTIELPQQRFALLSRGKGWCRKGKGSLAVWGEIDDKGYRVGPGKWVVGGNDGFSRKGTVDWQVVHVAVGPETWTIAG